MKKLKINLTIKKSNKIDHKKQIHKPDMKTKKKKHFHYGFLVNEVTNLEKKLDLYMSKVYSKLGLLLKNLLTDTKQVALTEEQKDNPIPVITTLRYKRTSLFS